MPSSTDLVHAVSADLEKIRETAPLILSLTNSVVQPLTANLLLAAGAVPAMLNDAEEAVEMLRGGTDALLVNLGTVTREQGAVMQTAVQEANRLDIPWVLDPVAVGALSLRTRLAEQLKERKPRIIRGNASEIMALAGYSSVTKGPESTSSSADALQAARELALHTGAAVLVTGRTDYSTDFWGTSHILNFIEGGANATLTGNFTLDASSAGDYAAYGQWSLQKNEDSKEVSMVWTPNAAPEASSAMASAFTATAPAPVPEPSSCMLLMAALGAVFLRRSVPRNE